ncbi:MAG TPA: glycosyltransferase family 39 protein [Patescibacteria group bacterium]
MNRIKVFLLALIVILGLWVRLYKIDNPVADWHSFRQADTSSVTEEWLKHGVNVLAPAYQDHSNIQSGKDNPHGYRMVEFPVYNLLHYGVYKLDPGLGIDKAGRVTSVILSLISIVLIFLIGDRLSGFFVGFMAALFMAILPFNIYYSRTILPEPLTIVTVLASYFFLLLSAEKESKQRKLWFYLSAISLSISILVKPYAIFFVLPHAALIFRLLVQQRLNILDIFLYGGIALGPFGWWRRHILSYPTGIPASDWLLNSSGIRWRPAWFRWLFAERLGRLILGIYGTIFLILGLIAKPKHEGVAYWLWFIGILTYFSVVAGGNVQHDYYQAIIIPFLTLILAKGVSLVLSLSTTTYSRWLTILMTILSFGFMISLAWYDIEPYYHINNPAIIEAGKEVDRLTPKDALVIAPYNGDTAFLYQTRRTGWPIGFYIEDKMSKGATYYVSVVYDDEARSLEKQYTLVEKTDKFIIIKLTPPAK